MACDVKEECPPESTGPGKSSSDPGKSSNDPGKSSNDPAKSSNDPGKSSKDPGKSLVAMPQELRICTLCSEASHVEATHS
jgi:hypothetical protein